MSNVQVVLLLFCSAHITSDYIAAAAVHMFGLADPRGSGWHLLTLVTTIQYQRYGLACGLGIAEATPEAVPMQREKTEARRFCVHWEFIIEDHSFNQF